MLGWHEILNSVSRNATLVIAIVAQVANTLILFGDVAKLPHMECNKWHGFQLQLLADILCYIM